MSLFIRNIFTVYCEIVFFIQEIDFNGISGIARIVSALASVVYSFIAVHDVLVFTLRFRPTANKYAKQVDLIRVPNGHGHDLEKVHGYIKAK